MGVDDVALIQVHSTTQTDEAVTHFNRQVTLWVRL
jgi:hypothetical protein